MSHPRGTIICALKNTQELTKRYPKRPLIWDFYCPDDEFFYFGNKGQVRIVHMKDWSVWVLDHDEGFPWTIRRRG